MSGSYLTLYVLSPYAYIFLLKDFSMDCGICYAYQLDGAIPDQVCDNAQCGQPFHQICLYEVKITSARLFSANNIENKLLK